MHISSIKIQPLVKNINSVVIRMFIFFKISFYKVIVFEFSYQLPIVVLIEFLFRKLMFHSLQKYSADNRNIAVCLNTLTGRCGTCFSIHTAHVVVFNPHVFWKQSVGKSVNKIPLVPRYYIKCWNDWPLNKLNFFFGNYVPEIARVSKFSKLDPSFRVTTQLHSAQGLLVPLAKTLIRSKPGTSRIIRKPWPYAGLLYTIRT